MLLSQLIEQLQWFEELFSGDLDIRIAMAGNTGPGVQQKDIIDIFCGPASEKGVDKLIIFGGN